MASLYLASKSPRRLEILASMGVTDVCVMPVGDTRLTAYEGDEVQLENESAENYVVRTAREKAVGCLAKIESQGLAKGPVLAADTSVILDGVVLGKPVDKAEAARFMRLLSGNTHEVRTAVVAGTCIEDLQVLVSVSEVHFAAMSEEDIERYVSTNEPYDKAGGYGIQGLAGRYIDRISGSYSGIMGLPVYETAQLLRRFKVID